MDKKKPPSVLAIGGSDNSGGAGIQADIKTLQTFGCHDYTAITAVTVQNYAEFKHYYPVPAEIVVEQIELSIRQSSPAAVKLGMIPAPEQFKRVVDIIRHHNLKNIVVDPVARSSSGGALSTDKKTWNGLQFLPFFTLITPNAEEAELLTGIDIKDQLSMEKAAERLFEMGASNILIKGGHMKDGNNSDDLLFADGVLKWLRGRRIEGGSPRGTGCALASAIAAGLAYNLDLYDAVVQGKEFITQAIKENLEIGDAKILNQLAWHGNDGIR